MSHRLYASDADRQRAYRARQRGSDTAIATSAPPAKRAEAVPSRPARIRMLTADAQKLSTEYQSWRDRLPPNVADGAIAAQLDEVIAQLDEVSSILAAIDPPRVGRSPG